jgi:hypothetical protein
VCGPDFVVVTTFETCSAVGALAVAGRTPHLTLTLPVSPLLTLVPIDRLGLVREQFSTVTVPEQVRDELLDGDDGVDAIRSLHDAGAFGSGPHS